VQNPSTQSTTGRRRSAVRLERHALGPRGYVFGVRVHEWHLGIAVLAAGLVLAVRDAHDGWIPLVVGVWLIAKDWRDLFPSTRDTAAWRLGIHRRVVTLREARRATWLAPALGSVAAITAVVNLVSVLLPDVAWRMRLLRHAEPMALVPAFHALALPLSFCLLVIAFYVLRRRRRAWQLAMAVLLGLGVVNLLKGLDVEEATLSFMLAAVLWWGRDSFHVRHEPLTLASAVWRVPALAAAGVAVAAAAVTVAAPPGVGVGSIARTTGDLLIWAPGDFRFGDDVRWIPAGVGIIGAVVLLAAAYILFRPLAAPRSLPGTEARRAAHRLVRAHGSDTLAYFKLRRDKHYLIASDESAFVAYRIENGVLLVSGDPVGPPGSLPGLVRQLCSFAEARGLRIGVLGASGDLLPIWQDAGLRHLYLGDEAIVSTASFSLEGRAIRKIRQSVARLEKAGYRCCAAPVAELDEATLDELDNVSARWLGANAERGFSMALDALRGDDVGETLVVAARDARGAVRGFIHFVPTYGRPAVSLSAMRRDRDTPNGLTEFLVVRSIELLRERGIDDVSLNFAAFARFLHSPGCRRERLLGRAIALANPYFQIESLYRFNAKFFPRWQPRYLLYEGAFGLPRAGLAAMRAEGQLTAWQR